MRGNPEQGPKAGLTPRLQVYDAEAWFARATAAGASDAMRCGWKTCSGAIAIAR